MSKRDAGIRKRRSGISELNSWLTSQQHTCGRRYQSRKRDHNCRSRRKSVDWPAFCILYSVIYWPIPSALNRPITRPMRRMEEIRIFWGHLHDVRFGWSFFFFFFLPRFLFGCCHTGLGRPRRRRRSSATHMQPCMDDDMMMVIYIFIFRYSRTHARTHSLLSMRVLYGLGVYFVPRGLNGPNRKFRERRWACASMLPHQAVQWIGRTRSSCALFFYFLFYYFRNIIRHWNVDVI